MSLRTAALTAVAGLLAAAGPVAAAAVLYTNAELVSYEPLTRVVTFRTNLGQLEAMKLADGLSGPPGLHPGDAMILAISLEPPPPRITRLVPSARARAVAAAPAPTAASGADSPGAPRSPAAARQVASPEPSRSPLDRFEGTVAILARQASLVDALWLGFRTGCGASATARYDRDWFGLWTGQVQADLSSGSCRDLQNQIVARGEGIKAAMAAAEEKAREAALLPGTIREVRRRHTMDWDGWELPAPERVD